MGGLIYFHIVCILRLQSTSRCDRDLLNLLLGFGLAPELLQVGLLRGRGFGSFRHLKESTWERVNDWDSGLYRRISHQGSTGESCNEGYTPKHETPRSLNLVTLL
jgi:hypothetical protein